MGSRGGYAAHKLPADAGDPARARRNSGSTHVNSARKQSPRADL